MYVPFFGFGLVFFSFLSSASDPPILVQNHKCFALLFLIMRNFVYLYCGEESTQCEGNQMITFMCA